MKNFKLKKKNDDSGADCGIFVFLPQSGWAKQSFDFNCCEIIDCNLINHVDTKRFFDLVIRIFQLGMLLYKILLSINIFIKNNNLEKYKNKVKKNLIYLTTLKTLMKRAKNCYEWYWIEREKTVLVKCGIQI